MKTHLKHYNARWAACGYSGMKADYSTDPSHVDCKRCLDTIKNGGAIELRDRRENSFIVQEVKKKTRTA